MDARFGAQLAEQKPIPGEQPRKPSALAGVSFGELYIFMWKLLAAAVVFALPFALIYLAIANSH